MTKEKKNKKTNVLAKKAKKKSNTTSEKSYYLINKKKLEELEDNLIIFKRHKTHNENKLIILIRTLSQLSDDLFDTKIYLQKCRKYRY